MKKVAILAIALFIGACTSNQRARNFGGAEHVVLPAGQKLILATWKGDDLWYLTEPAPENHTPRELVFRENSSFGLMNGTVIFREQK